jgi:uncharacterized protein (DUF302 family)
LIVLGVIVSALALVRYMRLVGMMRRGERSFAALAMALAMLGLAMGYYLIASRNVSKTNSIEIREAPMSALPENGVIQIASQHSVAETVTKLEAILQSKNVKLFTVVDHSGEAEKAGMKMPNTKLLIFGNPKVGTPLMLAAPSVALDLPLKILIAEDAAGKVWISYNAPGYLRQRHDLPGESLEIIAVIEGLAASAAQ